MAATSKSWKRNRFTQGIPLPYQRIFTVDELARLQEGKIPRAMEDKWFIYYDHEMEYLYLHRSWTGVPAYRLQLIHGAEGVHVTEALWALELAVEGSSERLEYEALLLDFLLSNLLLHERKPFPMPPGMRLPDNKGIVQHHNAGTAYPEEYPKRNPEEAK